MTRPSPDDAAARAGVISRLIDKICAADRLVITADQRATLIETLMRAQVRVPGEPMTESMVAMAIDFLVKTRKPETH
jgi:hypothetical protein